MSLDGYIAGPAGEYDWIIMDPDIDFAAMMAQFDTFLIGRKTYEAMQKVGTAGGDLPGIRSFVISRTMRPSDHPGITIEPDPAAPAASRARAAEADEAPALREVGHRRPRVRHPPRGSVSRRR